MRLLGADAWEDAWQGHLGPDILGMILLVATVKSKHFSALASAPAWLLLASFGPGSRCVQAWAGGWVSLRANGV
jgi:hypothetical protein